MLMASRVSARACRARAIVAWPANRAVKLLQFADNNPAAIFKLVTQQPRPLDDDQTS